ncbi:epidermal growth factor-like protein 7 [Pelobates fuscus]|uniref:epidermal growth factor-like protein 7 n=1 Tax=Pelobates fuscus TaxID=191477 RepID=UPI002FE4A817
MWGVSCLLAGCLVVLGVASTDHFYHSGRRICSSNARPETVSVTQSFVQPVYKPLMVMCEGQKVCSTYRTTYKVSYRQMAKKTSFPLYSCCPGWRRSEAHTHGCQKVSCQSPCLNGGKCSGFDQCQCPAGWTGRFCQTDVDECRVGSTLCAQQCINTAGSFRCQCLDGFTLAEDRRTCLEVEIPTQPALTVPPTKNVTAVSDTVREEMKELQNKIEVLEQKLQLILAPFTSLTSLFSEGGTDPIALLTHSFQQLDRIDSLSEQISFLEERLGTCSCKNTL